MTRHSRRSRVPDRGSLSALPSRRCRPPASRKVQGARGPFEGQVILIEERQDGCAHLSGCLSVRPPNCLSICARTYVIYGKRSTGASILFR